MKLNNYCLVDVVTDSRKNGGGQVTHRLFLHDFEWKNIGAGSPEKKGSLWLVGVEAGERGRRVSIPVSKILEIKEIRYVQAIS